MSRGWLIAGILTLGSQAQAAPPPAVPATVKAVTDCRAVTDTQARLACFDKAVGALADATASGAIVALDRQAVRTARRSLFGLDLPRLPFFDSDDDDTDAPKEITGKARNVRELQNGLWLVTFEDGAIWQTTEPKPRLVPPRPGDTLTIKKGIAGGYMLQQGSLRLRAKRVK